MYFLNIAPARPLTDELTYSSDQKLPIGTRVEIPIGKSKCYGFVVGYQDNKPKDVDVKEIISVTNEDPYFGPKNLEFYKWITEYYHYPLGELLSLVIPTFSPKRKPKKGQEKEKTNISQEGPLVVLTDEQKAALDFIRDDKKQIIYSNKNLLHGVTGSGKTEVYIEIIKDMIREGKSALLVVPEISLTPQLIKRVAVHFDGAISILHSEVSKAERYRHWMDLRSGKSHLCIGARSAIFSPMENIGLIVVDEEQDSSYKQDDRLRYNARDLAFVLAKIHGAKVILSSATPSVESYYNAKEGRYSYITLNKRVRELCLPTTILIDLKKTDMVSKNFSVELVKHIKNTLDKKEQVILYINRRGYSNSIICNECGNRVSCPKCSIALTEHKSKRSLLCHYCGYERNLPNYCDACGGHELKAVGSGTERIFEEIEKLFPKARITRMDSDSMKGKKKLNEMINRITQKEVDIIVGTQIVGKGHDFPDVTLVGIINADVNLYLPDFRSAERTFHQIMQVSGRAGRTSQGLVVLQTYVPEHFAVRMAVENNYKGFYDEELKNRNEVTYPPFTNLIDLKFSSTAKNDVIKAAAESADVIKGIIKKKDIKVTLLGPSPSTIALINKRYRHHILLKGQSRASLNKLIKLFNSTYKRNKKVRLSIDVDPYSLL